MSRFDLYVFENGETWFIPATVGPHRELMERVDAGTLVIFVLQDGKITILNSDRTFEDLERSRVMEVKELLIDLDGANRCLCDCHLVPGVMHFTECCQGQCQGCKNHFRRLAQHRIICPDWIVWAAKQKRAELRRLELFNDLQLAKFMEFQDEE